MAAPDGPSTSADLTISVNEESVLEEAEASVESSVIECPPTPEHVPAGSSTPPPPTFSAGRGGGASRKRKVR